ncbi:MAG: methylmalonate-semialdehyde dehydrogenase (CoA acylating) [Gemmatimonadetes bacterium]|nr:MAG: methylmalonate-semialdehyde dehydrogenase (CoA acylating) [Gemmatimonadota bacterium]
MKTLRNYIGGEWIAPSAADYLDLTNPATGEQLGKVPLSGARDVDAAVSAAQTAFLKWREVPPVVRARYLFKLKFLMDQQFEDLAATVTREHGKTLDESRGSVRRAIENVEHACGIPTLMMGKALEDVAAGIDCEYVRQPLGVFAAITPFNFPAMVPCWFWPYAIATGNTFVLKPSEQVPFSSTRILELVHEAGIPPGVLNMVHGAKDVVNALLAHPGIAGISFVGSSPVARHVYTEAAKYGKRVQALGGAKNHVIVMPDADMDRAVANISESLFGCAVISAKHKEKVLSYVEAGRKEGATLLLDGRATKVEKHPRGHFVGPTVFDGVQPDMTIGKEEIFGPVASVTHVSNLDEGIEMVQRSGFANATSIFTQSGKAAREFRYRVGVSMIGVNIGVAAPMAFFPFGGTKGSFFGDLKAHGQDSIDFYTDKKVVISRW